MNVLESKTNPRDMEELTFFMKGIYVPEGQV